MLIAFSGKKRTGKDYAADTLAAASPKLTFQRLNFADALYQEVADAIWPQGVYHKSLMVEKIAYIKAHKDNFRLILQGWGTDYRRKLCGDNYWVEKYVMALDRIPDKLVVITTDVRFKNEAECIKKRGGILVRVERNTGLIDNHESETDLDTYTGFDFVVKNNGTREELLEQLKAIKQ